MRTGHWLVWTRVLLLGISVANVSLAKPETAKRAQLGLVLGYGLYTGEAEEVIPSPYGVGLGVKGGYTLARVYLGAEANYFFGASRQFPEYGDVEGSLHILHYGAEVGVDLGLSKSLVLRPKLGLGAATVTAEVRVEDNTGSVSETGLVWAVGGELLWLRGSLFLAGQARYTSLSIDTRSLEDVPGLEVADRARLDGVLFGVAVGAVF